MLADPTTARTPQRRPLWRRSPRRCNRPAPSSPMRAGNTTHTPTTRRLLPALNPASVDLIAPSAAAPQSPPPANRRTPRRRSRVAMLRARWSGSGGGGAGVMTRLCAPGGNRSPGRDVERQRRDRIHQPVTHFVVHPRRRIVSRLNNPVDHLMCAQLRVFRAHQCRDAAHVSRGEAGAPKRHVLLARPSTAGRR